VSANLRRSEQRFGVERNFVVGRGRDVVGRRQQRWRGPRRNGKEHRKNVVQQKIQVNSTAICENNENIEICNGNIIQNQFWNFFLSSQIQREREEMERRDLRKMIMDGEAKQKEMKKKQQVTKFSQLIFTLNFSLNNSYVKFVNDEN